MYAVTGATGQLGRLVLAGLAKRVAPDRIVAAVRAPEHARDLAAAGFVVREADYDRPETLAAAFAGTDRLLFVSSNKVGTRPAQHRAVIDAARAAGIGFVAYTSLLHADTSPLALASEHRDTEAALAETGIAHALLRNGWYSENHLADLPDILRTGAVLGCAGDGRFSSAARADYADAAVAILSDARTGTYELAGDAGWSLPELAAEIGRQAGRGIAYRDLSPDAFAEALRDRGMDAAVADMMVDFDTGAAKGALEDHGGALARIIGRPTTPLSASVGAALGRGVDQA